MIDCVVFRLGNIWNRAAAHRTNRPLRIGYARVSTSRQNLSAQLDSLRSARCDLVYTDKAQGSYRHRTGLVAALNACRTGDQFVSWRLDRISRKAVHLIEIVEFLGKLGVAFRVLDGRGTHVDFTQPEGRFVLAILGSFAELEHELSGTRTRHGLKAIGAARPAIVQYELPLLSPQTDFNRGLRDAGEPAPLECAKTNSCCLEKSGH